MLRFLVLILTLACVAYARQSTISEWQGEWGEFSPQTNQTGQVRYLGQSLHISNCHDRTCRFEISCEQPNAHCGGSGDFELTSSEAVAAIMKPSGRTKDHLCTLTLRLVGTGAGKSIVASAAAGDCGYYCTANGQLEGRFPFRTAGQYYGSDLQSCFSDLSNARLAICNNQSLAEAENRWIRLLEDVQGLKQANGDARGQVLNALRSCDTQNDAQACIRNLIESNISNLTRQKNELIAGITEAGDAAEAARQISSITGSYRKTFENSDVQGDTFQSTDSLEIKQASATSISFNVHLEFFNGHQCEADGVAEFKRAGVFVYRPPEQDNSCIFEIVPKEDGVHFADPTGQCRMLNCGARGGWNGAGFLFTDRLKNN